MKITVKTLKGEQFPMDVEESDTVLSIKEKFKEAKGTEIEDQKLLHKGKMLVNEKTLADYNIKEGDFIVATIVIKKAAPKPATTQPIQAQQPVEQQVQPPVQNQPSTIPTQSQQPQQPSQPSNLSNTDMVTGAEYETAIQQIVDMGISTNRDDIKRALQAAYNNVDRAIDFLLSGNIPQASPQQPPQQQPSQQQPQGEGQQGGINPVLAALEQNPQFQQIRQIIMANPQQAPQILPVLLQQIQQSNPDLHQAITENQQQFLQLLLGGAGGADGQGGQQQGGQQLPPGAIQVTPEEKAAIERIEAMGFQKLDAIEAFFCCNKDENLALNYLLEQQSQGGLFSEHVDQEEAIENSQQQGGQQQNQGDQQGGQQDDNQGNQGNQNNDGNNGGNNGGDQGGNNDSDKNIFD